MAEVSDWQLEYSDDRWIITASFYPERRWLATVRSKADGEFIIRAVNYMLTEQGANRG